MHTTTIRAVRSLGLACFFIAFAVPSAHAYRVRLSWQPVSGVAGYKVYARQNGYPDFVAIDVGLPTQDSAGVLHAEQSGLLVENGDACRTITPPPATPVPVGGLPVPMMPSVERID